MGKASKEKGKVGERELAKVLRETLGINARRGQQFNGLEGKDVVGIPGVHIECKRTESLNIHKAMNQAKDDASIEEVPVVCHRRNTGEWLLTVPLERLDELAVAVCEVIDWSEVARVGLATDLPNEGQPECPDAKERALGA